MKISIVITNYNYERFIAKAIDSALAQDYGNVEVIVCDDGSTDRSREVIATYGDRVKSVNQVNGGMRAAYNGGYSGVTGDLVIFLDADDWLYPSACSEVVAVMRPGVSKVQFYLDLVDINGEGFGRRVPRHMHDKDALDVLADFGAYGSSAGSGNAYPVEYLRRVMPLATTHRHMPADSEPILFAPMYGEVLTLPKSIGAYRIHKTVGSDPLLLNNMPTGLWKEFDRMRTDAKIVQTRLQELRIPCRSTMLLAPWEARLLAVCLRFGGPAPAGLLDGISQPIAFALQSIWKWSALSWTERLLISGWMLGVQWMPLPIAMRLAKMHKSLAGRAVAVGSA